ncbi:hypothetical protein BDW59DRAFT_138886, partial [Aspergillus cavernicola]
MSGMPGSLPTFPPPGLPTPPDSPRKRRKHLRESDEAGGTMTVEDYLHRTDPFRTTTMRFPWPYPITTAPATQETIQRVNSCRADVVALLASEGFSTEPHHFFFRVEHVTKPGYPMGNTAQTMLRLVWTGNAPAPLRLGPTKDAVAELLARKGIQSVGIEIVFFDQCFRPSLFSIQPNHPAVPIYNAAKRGIMRLVNQRLHSEWATLSMFMMGLTKPKSTPTIVILVNPFAVHDWADLATQIKLRLPPGDTTALGINVEFLPGSLSLLPPATPIGDGRSCFRDMRADGVPTPGTSITVLPERGSGSLGPFVTLTRGAKEWNGALTNFHVVRPPPGAAEEIMEAAHRFGSSPTLGNGTEFDVFYFSPSDARETLEGLRDQIKTDTEILESLEKEMSDRQEAGLEMPARKLHIMNVYKERLPMLRQKLDVVGKMPIKLGRTLVSSGCVIAENKVGDWAFIEISSEAINNDERNLVNRMPSVPLSDQPLNPHNDREILMVHSEGDRLLEFGSLEKGVWYCKSGRSSEVTGGICDGVSMYCNWATDARQRWKKDGSERAMIEDGITEEFVITKENLGPSGRTQGSFCRGGDSGSAIVDDSGRVCGLLYGGATSLCGHRDDQTSGVCSDILHVKRWVEEKVPGATLSLPS